MKNPTANVSVIFGEAAKRAKRSVGLSNTNALAGVVHPNLNEQGALISKVYFTLNNLLVTYVFLNHLHYCFGLQSAFDIFVEMITN